MMMSRVWLALTVVVSMAIVGCNNNPQVTGKVTFPDGEPLTCGEVYFANAEQTVRGTINDNGEYSLGVKEDGDGCPPGTYEVYVQGAVAASDDAAEAGDVQELVATKFTDGRTSELTYDVKAGEENRFDFKVERP